MSYWNNSDDFAPESSPDSSPLLCASSSPPSSPGLDALELDDHVPIDPLAGAYKRQKRGGMDSERSRSPKRARHEAGTEEEDKIWEEAGTNAFERNQRVFNLMGKNLTRIDTSFIKDLKRMVVVPGSEPELRKTASTETQLRTSSEDAIAPALAAQKIRRALSRTESSKFAGENDKNIHLTLSQNLITRLPKELWTLENLTNLSLRNNRLTYLPPEIGNLKNLCSLNVSSNFLRYLPSELLNLNLSTLTVHPNKWIEPPKGRAISEARCPTRSPVPTLPELAFRVLRSPAPSAFEDESGSPYPPRTVMECYEPLTSVFLKRVSEPILQILDTCFPESLPENTVKASEKDEVSGMGRCPNPSHASESWFVQHLEERFTWETRVCGIVIGGAVPIRWRGCARGCLDYLEEAVKGLEVEDEEAIQAVKLDHSAPLDFDDDD